jgi:tetratricopeptide (TPR) repeat protein
VTLWVLPFVTSSWAVYLTLILLFVTTHSFVPLADSLTVRQLGSARFGAVRAWGSVGFGLAAAGVAVGIDSLKTLVEKYPTDLDFKFELGKLYRAAGTLDLAIQQFQSAQRNAKLRVAALTELGACFQGKGLLDLAVQQYQTAKNEINGFDETKKSVVYELATCLEAMNQKEKALVEYKLIYSCDISFRDVAVKIDQSYMES